MRSRAAARAIDALRRGWPVVIADPSGAMAILPVETATPDALDAFGNGANTDLLISSSRAATLKIINQRNAADGGAVRIARPAWARNLFDAVAIADPVGDLMTPFKGPFDACPVGPRAAAEAAMTLARLAGIMPAFFVREVQPDRDRDADQVSPDDTAAHEDSGALLIAARARLPVAASETAEIVAFRSPDDPAEHVALVIGTADATPPLVRLHSECLTGDILGSLKCDCGPQLHTALADIAAANWGILLYLRQEGRGIGLINKLRAYQLQDQGFDTVDANLRLGFAIDARDFSVAARMLTLLGVKAVRLLTNNPAKVDGLAAAGISVVKRVPLAIAANPHNARYLDTKRDRTGHQL